MLCIVQNFRITETPFTLTPRRCCGRGKTRLWLPPRLLRFLVTIAGGNCSIPPPQVSQSVAARCLSLFSVSTGLSLNVDLCVCVCVCKHTTFHGMERTHQILDRAQRFWHICEVRTSVCTSGESEVAPQSTQGAAASKLAASTQPCRPAAQVARLCRGTVLVRCCVL